MKDRNICTNKKIFFIFIFVCLLILQTAYIKNSEQLVGVYMITAYEKTTKQMKDYLTLFAANIIS
jgi:hypothetical protein